MTLVKITAKRQATLPKELCTELGVEPGDSLRVERRTVDGESFWVLLPKSDPWAWAGGAKRYATGKSHDLDAIRASVARARTEKPL